MLSEQDCAAPRCVAIGCYRTLSDCYRSIGVSEVRDRDSRHRRDLDGIRPIAFWWLKPECRMALHTTAVTLCTTHRSHNMQLSTQSVAEILSSISDVRPNLPLSVCDGRAPLEAMAAFVVHPTNAVLAAPQALSHETCIIKLLIGELFTNWTFTLTIITT